MDFVAVRRKTRSPCAYLFLKNLQFVLLVRIPSKKMEKARVSFQDLGDLRTFDPSTLFRTLGTEESKFEVDSGLDGIILRMTLSDFKRVFGTLLYTKLAWLMQKPDDTPIIVKKYRIYRANDKTPTTPRRVLQAIQTQYVAASIARGVYAVCMGILPIYFTWHGEMLNAPKPDRWGNLEEATSTDFQYAAMPYGGVSLQKQYSVTQWTVNDYMEFAIPNLIRLVTVLASIHTLGMIHGDTGGQNILWRPPEALPLKQGTAFYYRFTLLKPHVLIPVSKHVEMNLIDFGWAKSTASMSAAERVAAEREDLRMVALSLTGFGEYVSWGSEGYSYRPGEALYAAMVRTHVEFH